MDKDFLEKFIKTQTEIITKLSIIETKIDDYKEVKGKTDTALHKANQNEKDIEELKEKMTWQKWCTLILCTIGVIICVDFESGTNLASVALGVFAAMSFSFYTVFLQRLMCF